MENECDIQVTIKSEACQPAIDMLRSGVSYERIYSTRADWRNWRWKHIDTMTDRMARALEIVAPNEFWLRSLGRFASWSKANLSGADLSGANLWRANLWRADLSRADLSKANLSGAILIDVYRPENDLKGEAT